MGRPPVPPLRLPRKEPEADPQQYSARKMLKLKEAFEYLDSDGDGSITRSELQELNECFGFPPSEAVEHMATLDLNKDGKISYGEFARFFGQQCQWHLRDSEERPRLPALLLCKDGLVMHKKEPDVDPNLYTARKQLKLKDAFEYLDTDGDGYITRVELQDLNECFGISPSEAAERFARMDLNTDGKVSYGEFAKFYGRQCQWHIGDSRKEGVRPDSVGTPHRLHLEGLSMSKTEAGPDTEQYSAGQKLKLKEAFDSLHTDGDGCITRSELQELNECFGILPSEAAEHMARMDLNQDGKISYGEFAKFFWRQWYSGA